MDPFQLGVQVLRSRHGACVLGPLNGTDLSGMLSVPPVLQRSKYLLLDCIHNVISSILSKATDSLSLGIYIKNTYIKQLFTYLTVNLV